MRILFTTAWYPNRKVAGDGVFIQKHARAVARLNDVAVLMVQTDVAVRGLHVEVEAHSTQHFGAEGILNEVLVYVPKTRFEVPVVTGLLRLFWLMVGYLRGYAYIRRHFWDGLRPDVCHVNVLTRAAALPWLLWRMQGIPYLITEHWSRYARAEAYPQSRMQLWFGRLFVRHAAYVCPVSLNLERSMKAWHLDNRHYTRIGNVVDTDTFCLATDAKASSEPQVGEMGLIRPIRPISPIGPIRPISPIGPIRPISPTTRFVHVSWLRDESKNISGILRVLARLNAERGDWHLDIVGEGNDRDRLVAYAAELGLDQRVSFLPACQGKDLARVLQTSDALLMFSHFENQPVSVLEALSCGLPVIATAVGTIPQMLAGRRGITVPPGDEAQLLEVVRSFVTLHQAATSAGNQTLASARHEYVVSQHSPDVIARHFDVLYHAALKASTSKKERPTVRPEKSSDT